MTRAASKRAPGGSSNSHLSSHESPTPARPVDRLLRVTAVQLAEASRAAVNANARSPHRGRRGLRELEDGPPEWLTSTVGKCPARSAGVVLAWRRAALAIEDYRIFPARADGAAHAGDIAPAYWTLYTSRDQAECVWPG